MAKPRQIAIAPDGALLRQLWALLVVAGLVFQSGLAGLDLAVRVNSPWTLLGVKLSVCHTSRDGRTEMPAGDESQPSGEGCCLFCQAVQLAKGALPSPTFTLPTVGTATLLKPRDPSASTEGHASLHKLPRAPPAP